MSFISQSMVSSSSQLDSAILTGQFLVATLAVMFIFWRA